MRSPNDDDDRPEWEKAIRPRFTAAEDVDGEGARPSSLIPVHKLSTPDPLHDLQLRRDREIINERTVRELGPLPPGGLPVQKKRKPNVPYLDFLGRVVPRQPTTEENDEDEAMKLKQMAAAAILATGTVACNSPTPAAGLANTADASMAAQMNKIDKGSGSIAVSTTGPSVNTTKPTLGPEYMKIDSFVEFRKKLISDGWKPVVNPHCLEDIVGKDYKDFCSKYPGDIECRSCDMAPEIFIYTSQGYLTTRYIKDGTPLYVGSYGDIRDFDEPGRYGLVVDTWDYKSLN